MVVRKKTLGEVNININISDKTKPKKKKKGKRKATKRKGMILAPNFGSVAPIFPAYSFGTAERSKQEEEQFKTKELLLLTQGELKETKQKLLEYKPVPSVGRSQAPKTILSGSTRDLSKDAIPEAPPLIRQASEQSVSDSIKLMRQESIDKARETMLEARGLEQRLSTMRVSQSKLPTFDRTPTTNIPAQQTLKSPPLNKPILQRSDSVASDLTDDSMKPLPDQPPAQEDAIEALSLMKQALRPSIQEPARPKVELEPPKLLIPRPPLLSVEENPSRLIRGEEMKSFLPEPLGIIQEVDKPKRIIAPVNQVPDKIKRELPSNRIDIVTPQETRYRQELIKSIRNPSLFADPAPAPAPKPPPQPAEEPEEEEGFESAESSEEEASSKQKASSEEEREVVIEEGPTPSKERIEREGNEKQSRMKQRVEEQRRERQEMKERQKLSPTKAFFDKEGLLIVEKSKAEQEEDEKTKMKKKFMGNLKFANGKQTQEIAREMGISNVTSYKVKDGGIDRLKKLILERKGYN